VLGWILRAVLGALLVVLIVLGMPANGDTPAVSIAGPEEVVFDWTRDACHRRDIPDLHARAFRDARGRVQLISSFHRTRRLIGRSLNRVRRSCRVVLSSRRDANPAKFTDREWVAAPYTRNGKRVFALVHNEYHGFQHPRRCRALRDTGRRCWYTVVTLAVSRDGGNSYVRSRARKRLVASIPYRYPGDFGPMGALAPSNLIRNHQDGYYYVLVRMEGYREQPDGTCVLRTRHLDSPGSWRAWDGKGFGVRFADPYRRSIRTPRTHVCQPVSFIAIQKMSGSVTFNTFFNKFMLVDAGVRRSRTGKLVPGAYFSLSDDLIHWSPRKLIRHMELPRTYSCGDANPIAYPSVLDPDSPSRNFETSDNQAYLYYTRFHHSGCRPTFNRDLVRVRIEFKK
jgi:hypothetical protein